MSRPKAVALMSDLRVDPKLKKCHGLSLLALPVALSVFRLEYGPSFWVFHLAEEDLNKKLSRVRLLTLPVTELESMSPEKPDIPDLLT